MRQFARCVSVLALLFSSTQAMAQYSNESEAAIKVEGGNTETESYSAKTLNSYVKEKNTYKVGGHYTYGTSSNVEDTRNWDALIRFEHGLNGLSLFAASQIEGDRFKGINQRYNEDLGMLYKFIDTDAQKLKGEVGYRYTMQYNTNGTHDDEHKARLYSAYERTINENIKFEIWGEYLPNFTNSAKWILSFEPGFSIVLTKTFFLKISYRGDYENRPTAGAKKYDYQYVTALMARF